MMNDNPVMGTRTMKKKTIYQYTLYALMAALICIFAPMSVPIGPIPISLTNLVLFFAIFIIGTKGTIISFIVYMLIGAVGFPVFSGYAGGVAKIAGPTGGFLLGFLPMIFIIGLCYKIGCRMSLKKDIAITMAGMLTGTFVLYVFGTAWFVFQMHCGWRYALSVCVIPFVPFDIGKMVIANFLGRKVRTPLIAQGILE